MIENKATVCDVLRFSDVDSHELTELIACYQIELCLTPKDLPAPGSFCGGEEAGLVGKPLYLRTDTPIHSVLHQVCHYICMDSKRRLSLNADAGSDDDAQQWLRQH